MFYMQEPLPSYWSKLRADMPFGLYIRREEVYWLRSKVLVLLTDLSNAVSLVPQTSDPAQQHLHYYMPLWL